MLYPDIDTTQKQLQTAYDSTSAVTNYAQATLTVVPKVHNPPSWFLSTAKGIQAAQEHAGGWMKNTCPAVSVTVPCSVIQFSRSFDAAASKLLVLLQAIESQTGQSPTGEQRQQVDEIFSGLLGETQQQSQTVQFLQGQISDFFRQLTADHTALSDDLSAVEAMFAEGRKWVQNLQAVIGEDFINSQAIGPCHSIVEIKIEITMAIQSSGADTDLAILVLAEAVLKNLVSNQADVTPAIQNILDLWATLAIKIESVITDLRKAEGENYANILKQIDLMVARDQWKQAADFAAGLFGNTCTPE